MKKYVIKKQDLIHNIEAIKTHAKINGKDDNGKEVTIIAVVKANGYGLGIVELTKLLIDQGIEYFAVATIEEAIQLRKAGIKQKILMLSSIAIKKEIEELIENNITPTIGSEEAAKIINEIAEKRNTKIKVNIKIDTGFGRYGFIYTKPEKIVRTLEEYKNIEIEGTYSHFSLAFYEKSKYTQTQFDRFLKIIEILKLNEISTGMLHICNSSSFIKYPQMHLNAVRIGSAFTGRIPFATKLGLKKIGTLEAQVEEIKTLPKDFNIGYSNAYKTKKETKIAIIPCGYMDGVNIKNGEDMFRNVDKLRNLSNSIKKLLKKESLYVTIKGQKCEILGRIGTYHITVDITGRDIKIGDIAEIPVSSQYVNNSIRREYK